MKKLSHEDIVEILESIPKETEEFKRIKKNIQKLREMGPPRIF